MSQTPYLQARIILETPPAREKERLTWLLPYFVCMLQDHCFSDLESWNSEISFCVEYSRCYSPSAHDGCTICFDTKCMHTQPANDDNRKLFYTDLAESSTATCHQWVVQFASSCIEQGCFCCLMLWAASRKALCKALQIILYLHLRQLHHSILSFPLASHLSVSLQHASLNHVRQVCNVI